MSQRARRRTLASGLSVFTLNCEDCFSYKDRYKYPRAYNAHKDISSSLKPLRHKDSLVKQYKRKFCDAIRGMHQKNVDVKKLFARRVISLVRSRIKIVPSLSDALTTDLVIAR